MYKLSVIIPVYNAEVYLKECIDSVLNQSFKDFELLLINDGSTDNSGTLCDQYATVDKRVKVFHKENGGVSAARNLGIENAKGEWLTFIDSDDYVGGNYFNIVNEQENIEWIFIPFKEEVEWKIPVAINFKNQQFTKNEFITSYSLYPDFPEACAKFFKTEIIKKNGLKFNSDLKYGEDSLFNMKYLRYCHAIITSDASYYYYRNAEANSRKLNYNILNDTVLFKEFKKELEAYKTVPKFYSKTIEFPLGRYLRILYYDKTITKTERRGLIKELIKENYSVCLNIYTDPKIKFFLVFSHYTGCYFIFDTILSKLNR